MPIYRLGDRFRNCLPADRFWAAPDAQIIGDVRLGEDVGICSVPYCAGTMTRSPSGPQQYPGRGHGAHRSAWVLPIGEGCTIGHHAIIHGCRSVRTRLIGMGATILKRCPHRQQLPRRANALVTEGKTFPDNSLIVGSPARVVRTLDETAIAGLRLSADNYVRNWQRFARDFRRSS